MTLELLNLAFLFAVNIEIRFKHAFACPRPIDLSAQVQPIILTPGHGSFPSGHATQAYAVCYVLERLLGLTETAGRKSEQEQLQRQAARIAINRTIAGVHFPVDSIAGRLLGQTLGEYFVSRCTHNSAYNCPKSAPSTWSARWFDGASASNSLAGTDFQPFHQLLSGGPSPKFYKPFGSGLPQAYPDADAMLEWLWMCARMEWEHTNEAFKCSKT